MNPSDRWTVDTDEYKFRPIQNDENLDDLNPPVIRQNQIKNIDEMTFGPKKKKSIFQK